MSDAGTGWSEDRVETLKRLWGEGISASRIAAQLGGGVSRNAVIGKVHRLGLSGRAKGQPAEPQRPRVKAAAAEGAPSATPSPVSPATVAQAPSPIATLAPALSLDPNTGEAPLDENAAPLSERVTIMELRDAMCRWPLGDPTTPEFRFCGGRSITGLPYCDHHARIAYQPATERRRDRGRLAIRG